MGAANPRSFGVVALPTPRTDVKLVEDGYASTVDRAGHGLQRAFIMALLQHLAELRTAQAEADHEDESGSDAEPQPSPSAVGGGVGAIAPDLVLLIEEPELFQHPNRQRHLSKVLRALSMTATPPTTQVVYVTHSPLFVGVDRFDNVRRLTKIPAKSAGLPRETAVTRATMDYVAELLSVAVHGEVGRFTAQTLAPRLAAPMTPWMNEGFFADLVVLVEGEEDRAAILGTAGGLGHDLESRGVAVIPCLAKQNLDRAYLVFHTLDIPTYVVWDGDRDKKDSDTSTNKKTNRILLALLNVEVRDWPDEVTEHYAVFVKDLTTTVRDEVDDDEYEKARDEIVVELGLAGPRDMSKNPHAVRRVVELLRARGKSSPTLDAIVERIVAKRGA